jgi:hypothetical protein
MLGVRREVAVGLANREDQRVTNALLRLLADPDLHVRRAASEPFVGEEAARQLIGWLRHNADYHEVDLPLIIPLAERPVVAITGCLAHPSKKRYV